jgi:hypothetical protein
MTIVMLWQILTILKITETSLQLNSDISRECEDYKRRPGPVGVSALVGRRPALTLFRPRRTTTGLNSKSTTSGCNFVARSSMSGFILRVCAFAVGVSAGCATGMSFLHGDIYRAHAAVGKSVDILADSLGQPAPSSLDKGKSVVAASSTELDAVDIGGTSCCHN